jgi:hypothetical protein
VYKRLNYRSGQDDVPTSLCSQQKPTRGESGRAARELIVRRSGDRRNYTNLLHVTLHARLAQCIRGFNEHTLCDFVHPTFGNFTVLQYSTLIPSTRLYIMKKLPLSFALHVGGVTKFFTDVSPYHILVKINAVLQEKQF